MAECMNEADDESMAEKKKTTCGRRKDRYDRSIPVPDKWMYIEIASPTGMASHEETKHGEETTSQEESQNKSQVGPHKGKKIVCHHQSKSGEQSCVIIGDSPMENHI